MRVGLWRTFFGSIGSKGLEETQSRGLDFKKKAAMYVGGRRKKTSWKGDLAGRTCLRCHSKRKGRLNKSNFRRWKTTLLGKARGKAKKTSSLSEERTDIRGISNSGDGEKTAVRYDAKVT